MSGTPDRSRDAVASASSAAPSNTSLLRALLAYAENATAVIGVTDDQGGVTYLNPAARECIGLGGRPLHELTTADIFPPIVFDTYFEEIRPALLAGHTWLGPLPVRTPDGQRDHLMTVVGGVVPGGEVEWLACVGEEISAPTHAPDALYATHDQLTGLANRALLNDRLDTALARAIRTGGQVAVIFIDLDGMKSVNDTFGHHAGDQVLVAIAARLNAAVRPSDTVARLGGDEFVVVCEDVDGESGAITLAERIREKVEADTVPTLEGDVRVHASVGIAVTDSRQTTSAELLHGADLAMYRAKSGTGERIVVFDESLRDDLSRRIDVREHLAVGLTQRTVVAHYQPIVELQTGRPIGRHALARWNRPHGIVAAREFIDVAAASGLGVALDLAVLRVATVDEARTGRSLESSGGLHVSLSDRFLAEPDPVALICGCLEHDGVGPSSLTVRVSSRALSTATQVLRDLDTVGIRVAVRLTDLRSIPLVRLGDRSISELIFTPASSIALQHEEAAWRATRALVAVASTLGLPLTAVPVEDETQRRILVDVGCERGQGFRFGAPASMALAMPAAG